MQPTGTEEILFRAVTAGWIEVREDGSIWRIAQRRKSRWDGTVMVRPTKPHRIDAAVGVGYRYVGLMVDGRQIGTPAHRLVWRALRGPIPNGMTINHKNGKKADNRPANLELASYSDQMTHAYRTGLKDEHGEKNPAAKATDAAVASMRHEYAKGGITQAALAKRYGISFQQVSRIMRGDRRPKQDGPTADYVTRRATGASARDPLGRFTS